MISTLLADRGERGAEIDRGRGLADAALLVGDRDHARRRRIGNATASGTTQTLGRRFAGRSVVACHCVPFRHRSDARIGRNSTALSAPRSKSRTTTMRPDGSVRLGTKVASCVQTFAGLVKLQALHFVPSGTSPLRRFSPEAETHCASNDLSGATARAVTTLRPNCETLGKILDAHGMHVAGAPVTPLSLAQECGLFHIAFDEMDDQHRACQRARRRSRGREIRRPSRDRSRSARPAQDRASCSESAMWRVHRCATVDGAIEIGRALPAQQELRQSDRAAPLFHVKQG